MQSIIVNKLKIIIYLIRLVVIGWFNKKIKTVYIGDRVKLNTD